MPVPTMPGSESAMPNSQHRLLAPAIQQQAINGMTPTKTYCTSGFLMEPTVIGLTFNRQ